MIKTTFKASDGKLLALYTWDEVENPIGAIKISHGMAEHSARYDDFAKFLNSEGYVVVMNDLRAHGETCGAENYGYDEGDIFSNNVSDQLEVLDYMREHYKGLPLFMMGHSYGSFIAQAVIERAPNVKGYIVCGSCYMKGLLYKVGHMISNHMCKKQGGRTPCTMLANMSFGAYEKKFPGKNCWLNREQSEVDKYNADPACGFTCSANFYRSFMGAMNPLYSKTAVAGIDKNKPIFIISGALDPVGNYGKGVDKLLEFYQKVGVVDVTEKLYEGARHEILNETHKNETYQDIIKWLNAHR